MLSINQWQTDFKRRASLQYIKNSQLHLDKLQNFYGSLAVGCHHHVAVGFPADSGDKLVDVLLFPIAVQERPDGIELELEQMLRESLKNQCDFLYCMPSHLIVDIKPIVF